MFGVNAEDALEEAKKNIPLLKAIFLQHAYPKLTVLEAGFRQWATNIGGPFLSKDGWYFKHQAYALFQQISKVRKMSNNLKDTTRTDPVLKELLIAIKELPKRSKKKDGDEPEASQASQPTSKKGGRFMRRALLRRLSSSPSSKAPIPSKLSQQELAEMFGAPAEDAVIISSDEDMDELEAAADQEAAAELQMWAMEDQGMPEQSAAASSAGVPDQSAAASSAGVPEQSAAASSAGDYSAAIVVPDVDPPEQGNSQAFWSSKDQKKLIVLPSGQTMEVDVPDKEEKEEKEEPVRKRVVKKRPAASIGGLKTIKLTNATSREAAYLTYPDDGKHRLLVEVTKKRAPNYLELIQQIKEKLEELLQNDPDLLFAKLKEEALAMREQIC